MNHPAHVNNPHTTRWARYHDRLLCLPPWSQVRRSEENARETLFAASLRPGDSVREVGPGTGRYAVDFARRAATVMAVEHSPGMVFTTPYCSFLAQVHRADNRLRGIDVTTYTQDQIRPYLPRFEVESAETGLNTAWWRGLTLACRATRH